MDSLTWGETLLLLANRFQQVLLGHNSPWKELIIFLNPTTDAEHSIIFNSVFGSCPKKVYVGFEA